MDCGGDRHGDGETCPRSDHSPVCINCKGPHKASDYSCPEYILQRRIREISARENIPLSEAGNSVRSREPVAHGSGSLSRDREYPELPGSSLPFRGRLAPSLSPHSRLYSRVVAPSHTGRVDSSSSGASLPPPSSCSASLSGSFLRGPSELRQKIAGPNTGSQDQNNNETSYPPPRTSVRTSSRGAGASSPSSFSSLFYPNGRTPSVSGNGVAVDPEPELPPILLLVQRFLGLEASHLSALLQLACVLMERLEPILKALGIHDIMGGFVESFLLTPFVGLSARDSSRND